MILHWCEETENAHAHLARITKPTLDVDDVNTHGDPGRDYLYALVDQMSDSYTECCESARELRQLTKTEPFMRKLFGVSKPLISQLVNKNTEVYTLRDHDFEEDLITIVFNIAIHETNKEKIADNSSVIKILSRCLEPEVASTRVAKRNAAAALFTLSTLNSIKPIIRWSGALFNMISSLEVADAVTVKDFVSVIISLCAKTDYKVDTINLHAVPIIVENIINDRFVDELLPLLSLLSYHKKAFKDLKRFDAMPWLVRVISRSSCEITKEHAMVALFDMAYHDRTLLKEIAAEPGGLDALRKLAESGTWMAKKKASGILYTIPKGYRKR